MRKEYYFDKIKIDSYSVSFINSSEPIGTIWHAHTFSKFLNLLQKTKLQDNLKYDIICNLRPYETTQSFEYLIKYFANLVYKDSAPEKEELVNFYKKAQKIYEDAKKDKELLLAEPNELIK